jgi:hypothetical protein
MAGVYGILEGGLGMADMKQAREKNSFEHLPYRYSGPTGSCLYDFWFLLYTAVDQQTPFPGSNGTHYASSVLCIELRSGVSSIPAFADILEGRTGIEHLI